MQMKMNTAVIESSLDKSHLEFIDRSYPHTLVGGFHELWQSGSLTDVVIRVKGQDFDCHRSVLAASSCYFRAMFAGGMKESATDTVVLDCLEPVAMETVLRYVYTGKAEIDAGNVQSLLQAASLFQFQSLVDVCASFLQGELEAGNCVGVYRFALLYLCGNLADVARNFILKNFAEVSTCAEFNRLSAEQLQSLLSDDGLIFLKRENLLSSVQRWLQHDFAARRRYLVKFSEILEAKGCYVISDIINGHVINVTDATKSSLLPAWQNFAIVRNNESRRAEGSSYEVMVCFGSAWSGSSDSDVKSCAVKCYDPVMKKFFGLKSVPETVAARDYMAACKTGHSAIVGLRTGKFLSYDLKSGTWDVLSKYLLTPQAGNTMASIGGSVYICGKDGRFFVYNTESKQLDSRTDLICPVRCPTVVSIGDKIFALGGKTRSDLHNEGTVLVQCYDTETDSWSLRRPIPEKCAHIAAAVLNGLIYIVGAGCREHLKSTRKVLRYNPTSDTWCQLADLNRCRQSCDAVVCNGQLYVTGGYDVTSDDVPKDCPVREMECYDPVGNEWHPVGSLPFDIAFHTCITVPLSKTKRLNGRKVLSEE